tara:strand:+ start:18031 stop:18258 length:228 start_codon:yes stop_codon:yes gene_type:complete
MKYRIAYLHKDGSTYVEIREMTEEPKEFGAWEWPFKSGSYANKLYYSYDAAMEGVMTTLHGELTALGIGPCNEME